MVGARSPLVISYKLTLFRDLYSNARYVFDVSGLCAPVAILCARVALHSVAVHCDRLSLFGASAMAAPAAASGSVGDHIVQEVRKRITFVTTQVALGLPKDKLMAEQTHALSVAIRATENITMDDASAVGMELASGPWTADQRATLATVLSDKVVSGDDRGGSRRSGGSGVARKQQQMNSVHRFFTYADWTAFRDASLSLDAKMDVMVDRLWKLGATCPSESLQKRALATLLAVGLPGELQSGVTAENKVAWMKTIQQKIKAIDEIKPWPYQHIVTYPHDPRHIPVSVFRFAYADTEPIECPVPEANLQYLDYCNKHLDRRDTSQGVQAEVCARLARSQR